MQGARLTDAAAAALETGAVLEARREGDYSGVPDALASVRRGAAAQGAAAAASGGHAIPLPAVAAAASEPGLHADVRGYISREEAWRARALCRSRIIGCSEQTRTAWRISRIY